MRKWDWKSFLRNNVVTLMFVLLCVVCTAYSGLSPAFVAFELVSRIARNGFIVLALIIPIIAGMGINFAISIGAMAAQIALLWVLEWRIPGIGGLAVAALMTVPLATLFGFLAGKLLNKMKGQEMIGSMILGYFANGVYMLLFLFVFGSIIPLTNSALLIKGSTGVANTMDLSRPDGLKYALDGLLQIRFETPVNVISEATRAARNQIILPLLPTVYVVMGLIAALCILLYFLKRMTRAKMVLGVVLAVLAVIAVQFRDVQSVFTMLSVPAATFLVIAALCLLNLALLKTRLGQQFRAVGQNRTVANASGINVDRTRIIAIIISTVLAGLGQLIFLQNIGNVLTYGAHEQVGLYAGAAILVGGASIARATNSQALIGCVLFHMLFIVAPPAANTLFGDPGIGEYFRVFVSYGVIALSLVLHAWKGLKAKKAAAKPAADAAGK